ncbi:MAG: pyridoxal phosphate-dependent aminotransferase [Candidatus Sumerlaeaceae bacterium]|nr:pyridoxal phosphate-dependent aminotransferase [Candidatus Sumerlaeaceae bacterium]
MDEATGMGSRLMDEWNEGVPSQLARAVAECRARGTPICDLITANPQEEGLEFPPDLLRQLMQKAVAASRFYRPDPQGLLSAREAVAGYHGCKPEQVLLTPGTSFAYWCAFRLLARPGEEILCPHPTYPLFDDLARLAHVTVRRYHMHHDGLRWAIDPGEVEFQVTARTRIIVVVSPHNPTGSVATAGELLALAEIARRHGLVIVFDEVFREFTHGAVGVLRPAAVGAPLALVLNGFSKMFSLPGLKAGWLVAEGEQQRCEQFLRAAESLSDPFLAVSEATQAVIPLVFAKGAEVPGRFRQEYTCRMGALVGTWRDCGVAVSMPEAGVYLPVKVASAGAQADESALARVVRETGILAHPGEYYGLPEGHLVMTCVKRPPWPVTALLNALRR